MAFNIIAETTEKLDFVSIHSKVVSKDVGLEFIPMQGLGLRGGDALGISIPAKNANEETWNQLKPILKKLKSEFNCNIYDLYGGQKLGLLNYGSFKKNLLQK